MKLTAIFDGWLLGDGCYPPLRRGQLVNLAFQCQASSLDHREPGPERFESMDDATCRLAGILTRVYAEEHTPIAVVEAGVFRCYVESPEVKKWDPGSLVSAEGTLAVDYYIWSEFIAHEYPDVPNLFYSLRVARIRRVLIPKQFISRSEHGIGYPASVPLDDVTDDDIAEVEVMLGEEDAVDDDDGRPPFFIVDFSDDDLSSTEIPRTFR
jgi:hypothetical protein